ncbi:MAG: asparaginase domain-containing protein [Flavicella sp.]
MESITIICTGGTFDKKYNELNGELFFKETHIHEMLQLGRSKLDIEVNPLMMIDSLQMQNKERDEVVKACLSTEASKIVITHGTDTMSETAAWIAKKNIDKTIVLTGAMIPYQFGSSDGLFNLGSSLAFVQTLKPGVYISMNGKIFDWDNVKKNKDIGEFETIR